MEDLKNEFQKLSEDISLKKQKISVVIYKNTNGHCYPIFL